MNPPRILADSANPASAGHTPGGGAPAPFRLGNGELVVLLAMIMALQALAVDAMLPALATLSRELGAHDANQRQLVIGVFLMCNGACALYPGTLADRFGRRPVLLTCLLAYTLFSGACIWVTSFQALLVFRGLMGVACAGLIVLAPTIIRDRFEGDHMARLQSLVGMTFMVVPVIAPTLGQAVLLVAGWRWIFWLMVVLGLAVALWTALRLPETLDPAYRRPIQPRLIATTFIEVLSTRRAFGYIIGLGFVQGALFGYINSTQQLLGEHFGAGARFPLFFAGMATVMAATSFVNARIVLRFGARRVSHAALFAYIAVSATQLMLAVMGDETLWRFTVLMTANLCLMGFIGANFTAIALEPFAAKAGAAASVQVFLRTGMGAVLGTFVGQAYDGTARPLAASLLMAGTGALVLVTFSESGKLTLRRQMSGSTIR